MHPTQQLCYCSTKSTNSSPIVIHTCAVPQPSTFPSILPTAPSPAAAPFPSAGRIPARIQGIRPSVLAHAALHPSNHLTCQTRRENPLRLFRGAYLIKVFLLRKHHRLPPADDNAVLVED